MKDRKFAALVAVAIIVIMTLLIFSSTTQSNEPQTAGAPHLIIGGRMIVVEIADNPDTRSRGLMFRDSLPKDHGMLFVFDSEGVYSIWMKNMRFRLDIIWINSDGIVAHIERNVPPCSEQCPIYGQGTFARYVLEVNSGFAQEVNLQNGSFVKVVLANR